MNGVTLGGHVIWLKGGRTQNRTIYVMFRVALQRNYKSRKSGKYESDYAFCTAFDNKYRHLATYIGKNAKKGYFILLNGHIHSRPVTNNGKTRDVNSIAVDDVDHIFPSMKAIKNGSYRPQASNSTNSSNNSNNNRPFQSNNNSSQSNNSSDPFSNNGQKMDISDDDLPF